MAHSTLQVHPPTAVKILQIMLILATITLTRLQLTPAESLQSLLQWWVTAVNTPLHISVTTTLPDCQHGQFTKYFWRYTEYFVITVWKRIVKLSTRTIYYFVITVWKQIARYFLVFIPIQIFLYWIVVKYLTVQIWRMCCQVIMSIQVHRHPTQMLPSTRRTEWIM